MKHAYLIIAHHQPELLKKLIKMLDYSDNDIYLFVDLKVRDDLLRRLRLATSRARLVFVERHSVFWGDYSQIQAEMTLLREATKAYHDYYHLLSGVDLPIKSHDDIDAFFVRNKGFEFVSFDEKACQNRDFEERCRYYHVLLHHPRADRLLVRLQKLVGINRLKKSDVRLMKGSNWFDITHEFARYVCEKMAEEDFDGIFRHSSCGDEVFLQTILQNSPFLPKRAAENIRFIDWSRHGASPETLTGAYWPQLQASACLFARKFDLETDADIVAKIEAQYGA